MNATAKLPTEGSEQSAGHDLHATETKTLQPGERTTIGTGSQMQCKEGTCGRTAPCSGTAMRHSMQTPGGVINGDCRGEMKVTPQNADKDKEFNVTTGNQTAQPVIEKTDETPLMPTEDPTQTSRATNGLGSAGTRVLQQQTHATEEHKSDPPGTHVTLQSESKEPPDAHTQSKASTDTNEHNTNLSRNNSHTLMINTEMWHQRMGHTGLKKPQATAQCTKGMPRTGNLHPQFHCQACAMAKMTKTPRRKKEDQATNPGERFHMDFGFVRGPKNPQVLLKQKRTPKHETRTAKSHHPIKTSHDGHSSCLLMTDAASRFTWMFLTKTKEPPIETLNTFMTQHGLTDKIPKLVQTDQGGELARSKAF